MLKRFSGAFVMLLLLAIPAAATTYTPCGGLSLPVPGDPAVANTWGTILNTNFSLIDSWNGGALNLSVAGNSNVVLTGSNGASDQTRNQYLNFTGALTGNIDVLFAAGRCESAIVHNGTSGAYTLSAGVDNGSGSPAGTVYAIPQGETAIVYSDGTDVVLAATPKGIGAAATGVDINTSNQVTATHLASPLPLTQGGTANTTGQPSGTASGDLTGSYPSPTLVSSGVSAGTYTTPSITINAKGLITSASNISTPRILATGNVLTGTTAVLAVDLSSYSAYKRIEIDFDELLISGGAAELQAQISTNAGSSYVSANYRYAATQLENGATSAGFSSSDSKWSYLTLQSSEANNVRANLYGFNQAVPAYLRCDSENGYTQISMSGDLNPATTNANAIKFFMSAGTVLSGNYRIIGYP
jgi:hypothetical protein